MDLNNVKGTKFLTVPVYDGVKCTGSIDVEVAVKDGPLPTTDLFDWTSGNVRMVIDRAVNLPPAFRGGKYVIIDLEKQREQTLISNATANPIWQTAITYQCRSGSSNCVFTVCAHDEQEDIILGQATLNLAEARHLAERGQSVTKLKLDGLCRGTGGELWLEVQFVAYPKNMNKYRFLKIHLNSVRDMMPNALHSDRAKILIGMGGNEVATSLARIQTTYDEYCLTYKETFDVPYNKEEIISFTLVDGQTEEELCGCAYDLWAALRLNRESIRGDLWLKHQDQVLGKLRLHLTYLPGVPEPWPDACIVDVASLRCQTFGAAPLTVSVRDATAYGSFVDGFEDDASEDSAITMGKKFHIGRTYGLKYAGQPNIWVDVAMGPIEVWSCEVPITRDSFDDIGYHDYPLIHAGREVGWINLKHRFIDRPTSVTSCSYLKLQLTDLAKVPAHFGDKTPAQVYLTVDLDHKNTVQCPPIKVLSDHEEIYCNWVAPYRQQPIIRFTLRDPKGFPLSTADLNVWDVMNKQVSPTDYSRGGRERRTRGLDGSRGLDQVRSMDLLRASRQRGDESTRSAGSRRSRQVEEEYQKPAKILVPLYKRNGTKGGKVYVKVEFIYHPKDLRFPKQLLVGFSHGTNIGGDYAYDPSRDVTVRLRSGENNIVTPPKTKNNLWGNWTAILDMEPGMHTLAVEVYDKASLEAIGSLYVHIWDLFRNPFAEWAGSFKITKGNVNVGVVHMAMRLLVPQRLTVQFGDGHATYKVHPRLRYSKVFASDSPKDVRRKFIAACREIAEMKNTNLSDEDRTKYRLAQLTLSCKTTHVDVASGNKLMLPDKSTLLSLFPGCTDKTDKLKVIDLAIMSVSKGKMHKVDAEPEDGALEPCTSFPTGESAQSRVGTLARIELPWVKMASDHSKVGTRRNRLSALVEKTFELHPHGDAPLGALGYAAIALTETQRLVHTLRWTHALYDRVDQWVPAVIHAITSANCLVSRISPVETVVGYDLPDYARTVHVSNNRLLPAFNESDVTDRGRKALVYRNCGSGRTVKFRSNGMGAWTPPALPRTSSMARLAKKHSDPLMR
ncbi:C2 domain protein [Gregarina niphandrodes]|uniref:C2 domain protein n=1 Tax=Gregarina niphandrodes TaxID=110365 RepID=A0A023B9H7_GRENI|nr:C2 domain protein [Gregarina niphandrodes]EZG72957.1 C2 domain protein [Gregarina niphandrodes]|eukprot:XP_011129716.1 C2 domain protein [Gregarina niphandrodes]